MKIAALIARILLGVMFLVFGLNEFLNFIPMPLPAGLAGQYLSLLVQAHYNVVLGTIMVASAILFLIGRFVPLALVLIGPVLVNVLVFHLLLNPSGIGMGLFATVLWFVVFYSERSAFAGIFRAKA